MLNLIAFYIVTTISGNSGIGFALYWSRRWIKHLSLMKFKENLKAMKI